MHPEEDENEAVETDLDALTDSAVDLFREGRFRQARRTCKAILRREQRPVAVQILAKIAHQQGRIGEAAEGYEQFLRMVPEHADSHFRLGIVLAEGGQMDRAIEHFEKATGLDPKIDTLFRHLGDAYGALGHWDRAIAAYAEGLERLPDDGLLNRHLGIALRQLGRLHAALACFERAVGLQPKDAGALVDLARTLLQLGQAGDAIAPLQRAVAVDSGNTEAQLGLAMAFRQLGQVDEAVSEFEDLLTAQPNFGEAHYQLSIIRPDSENVAAIQETLREPDLPMLDSVHCTFALANLMQQQDSLDEAFRFYQSANAQYRRSVNYEAGHFSKMIDSLISVYSKQYFEERADFGADSELPVFVVGMPRSGTTLVDQIISSHPDVHGAGELDAIRGINFAIARELGGSNSYPACMQQIDADVAEIHAAAYLEELQRHDPVAARITDKLPANYLAIGLIKTLLPRARIVHCSRSPLDTCASLYFNFLPLMSASFDLEEIAAHYRDYQRLMAHWDAVFGDEIYTVPYEDLVARQEPVSRDLISYIGLDWDEACLNYWRNDRNVSTPSNLDVRNPVYQSSVDRWKRFESYLQPLVDALGAETR